MSGNPDLNADVDEWIRRSARSSAPPTSVEPAREASSLVGSLLGIFKTSTMSADDILLDSVRFDHQIKKLFAWVIVIAVVGQVVLANLIVVLYLWFGFGSAGDPRVLVAWFSATVVEVIGLMAVITRYLFPSGGPRKRGRKN